LSRDPPRGYFGDHSQIKQVQDDLVARLTGTVPDVMSDTPLQKALTEVRLGLLEQDKVAGNGGVDVLSTLTEFCKHPNPMYTFTSIREYLDYRYRDVAMM
jgi:hypothetical protein